MEDIIEHFRDRRPIVLFLIFFTLIGGVVAGIICVCNNVCDFGTAYINSMFIGTFLTILILGYSRFAFAFKWLNGLLRDDWWDERHPDPMLIITGIGELVLIAVVPVIEVILLPIDILMTIILSIIDIASGVSIVKATVKTEAAKKSEMLANAAPGSKLVRPEDREDILKLSELSDREIRGLCRIIEEFGNDKLGSLGKNRQSTYLGRILLTKGNFNLRTYFVYNVKYLEMGIWKEGIFAPYFNNLCRRKDGVIIFLGGRPEMDQLIFPSVDALCATLPSGYKRDSDFINFYK